MFLKKSFTSLLIVAANHLYHLLESDPYFQLIKFYSKFHPITQCPPIPPPVYHSLTHSSIKMKSSEQVYVQATLLSLTHFK